MDAIVERFEARTARIPLSGCHLWTGSVNDGGYGKWYAPGFAERYAHRLAWLLFRGPIPEGMRVLHNCDVPCCVNPAHLRLGTPAENTADMMLRGRDRHNPDVSGERNPRAKLSAAQVEEIRASTIPGTVLGPRYGVSSTMIYFIRNGKSWRRPDLAAGRQ